jgi:hypothetical protein
MIRGLRLAIERSHSKVRDSLKDAADKATSQQMLSIIDATHPKDHLARSDPK